MNVTLTKPEIERFTDALVRSGEFPTVTAVVEAAVLKLMAEYEEDALTDEDWAAIAEARKEIERGEGIDFREFAADLRKEYGIK